jgi:TonB family protein
LEKLPAGGKFVLLPVFASFILSCAGLSAQLIPSELPPCVEPGVENPKNMVQPKYPKDALRAGTDTVVDLRAVVTPEGKTAQLTGPPNEFGRAAINAVRKWHFYPAIVKNRPVETTFTVHVHFNSVLRQTVTSFKVESPRPEKPPSAVAQAIAGSSGRVFSRYDPGVVPPKQIYMFDPEYTEEARRAEESGSVILSFVVDADGRQRDISVACSSVPDLNQSAIDALKLWKFAPGIKNGEPVSVRMDVEMSFHSY